MYICILVLVMAPSVTMANAAAVTGSAPADAAFVASNDYTLTMKKDKSPHLQRRMQKGGQQQQPQQQEQEGEDQMLSLTFSLWHPDMNLLMSAAMTDEEEEESFQTLLQMIKVPVLNSLQDFFCEDTGLVVVDEDFDVVCSWTPSEDSMLQSSSAAIFEQNPDVSYVASVPANVLVSPFSTANDDRAVTTTDSDNNQAVLYWWTWNVNYKLEQIGTQVIDQANAMNVSDHRQYMQDVTQLALDVSVMEGLMDSRLAGTSIYMSRAGIETEMFQVAAEDYASTLEDSDGDGVDDSSDDDESGNTTFTDADLGTNGRILMYIGFGLLVINVFVVTALTVLARRRRRYIESRGHNHHTAPRLVTEKAVNQMLETGRRESEKYVVRSQQESGNR
jgi:hypothetical protein